MNPSLLRWAPAVLFLVGAGLVTGLVAPQQDIPLRASLASVIPYRFEGLEGVDQQVPDAEAQVAGFSDYLLRSYSLEGSEGEEALSLYVGYYESQMQGKTIHSPKNCLPGSGWEPLRAVVAEVTLADGTVALVNRYILQRDNEQALVLYWYQGRGRVAHNEYAVKFDLLRDAALRRRTDEALVRIVVPVARSEEDAFRQAQGLAAEVVPALAEALPR